MIEENIKNYCVSCKKDLPQDRDKKKWYEKRGNYCRECCAEASRRRQSGGAKDRHSKEQIKNLLRKIGQNA